jgi:hypothetical protein
MKLSSFYQRRGSTLAGVFSVALVSVMLLCGAAPIENFLPQGAMQGDLNAGGHSLTNAATISATNVVVSGSLTLPSAFTLPFSSITSPPTLGPLATLTPSGTASSSTYLRGDNAWATVPSGYTLPVATGSVLGGVKQGANVTIAGDGTLSIGTPVLPANNGSDFASIPVTRQNLGVPYNQVIASSTSNTATTAQIGALFNYTTGTTTLTPTLPTAAAAGNGATYYFRKADSGRGSVLVNGVLLGIAGHALEMVSDGTTWYNRPFLGGIDSSGNVTMSSPQSGNLIFTPGAVGGTGVFTVNGMAQAGSYSLPTGPMAIGTTTVCDSDSRFSGQPALPTGINGTAIGYLGYFGEFPSMLQVTPFFQNATVLSTSYPGLGIADFVANYQVASVTTTCTGTVGTNKLVVTGSTTGLGLSSGGIGGPGLPPGTSYSYATGTVTLNSGQYINALAPSNLLSSQTNATYDFATALPQAGSGSIFLPVNCSPHESSPALSGFPGYFITNAGINDTNPTPPFSGTVTSGSAVITGISGLRQMVPGYTVTLAANTTVVSNTTTTLTMNHVATGSGSVAVTVAPVDAAWGVEATVLINKALADGYTVIYLTLPPAKDSAHAPYDAHRIAFNNYIVSTYGGSSGLSGGTVSGVYVIDTGNMPIWTASNSALYYYTDSLHFSTAGESEWAKFVSAKCAQLFPSAMTGPVQNLNSILGINPQAINWGRFLGLDPQNLGGELDIGTGAAETIRMGSGWSISLGAGGVMYFGETTGVYQFGNMTTPSTWGTPVSMVGMTSSGILVQTQNANGNLVAQTAAVTLASVTAQANSSSYHVSGYLNVTAVATDTIELEVTYTDENNVAQTKILNRDDGVTSGVGQLVSTTGDYSFITSDIHAKSGTVVILKTILPTSSGSITYDGGGNIRQGY